MKTLKELLEMQNKLDSFIRKNKNINMSTDEMLTNSLLALQVEVSELANATGCFKYWKDNKNINKNEISEEYADILHFVLSVGNQLGFTPEEIEMAYVNKNNKNYERQKGGY